MRKMVKGGVWVQKHDNGELGGACCGGEQTVWKTPLAIVLENGTLCMAIGLGAKA